jgi:hypothetical protein
MRKDLQLRLVKSSSSLELDLMTSLSGTAPSSKNLLIAFWMFHLALVRYPMACFSEASVVEIKSLTS